MTGSFWTAKDLKFLLDEWRNRRADITTQEFARNFSELSGRSVNSVVLKIKTMPEYRIPPSTHTRWNDPPKMEGDALVLMDAQIPYHHAEFLNRCIALCKRWNIRQVILGGDALDLNAFSMFPPNFENDDKRLIDSKSAAELMKFADSLPSDKREELLTLVGDAERENGVGGEVKESRIVLRAIAEEFDQVLWIMGNHEQRILRLLQRILPVETLSTLFGTDGAKWIVSPYYYCELLSGGEKWQIEHPINTGKGSSKKLAPKFGCHIVMGHNHHFSITTDPSGRYYAIEPGMVMDEERMPYASQRHNAADAHVVGALIIRGGKPTPLNKFTDWEMLK